jgi:2-dehydropantoate 2-reductase
VKICVYGAGAVGGALAVRLCEAGEDVSVVARGAHAQAIRERGLTLIAGETKRTVHVLCVDDPDELDAPDVVFVTVKQTHLPAMADSLSRILARGARVVLAMNGIPWTSCRSRAAIRSSTNSIPAACCAAPSIRRV